MSDRHEIIAEETVEGFSVWTAYVPEKIRFVDPRPYATVVFDEEQNTVHESFANTEEAALVLQSTRVSEIERGLLEPMNVTQKLDLTEEQQANYTEYMIEEMAAKLAERIMDGSIQVESLELERDPATGHHPDCDGECGGTGVPFDVAEKELPGQYL